MEALKSLGFLESKNPHKAAEWWFDEFEKFNATKSLTRSSERNHPPTIDQPDQSIHEGKEAFIVPSVNPGKYLSVTETGLVTQRGLSKNAVFNVITVVPPVADRKSTRLNSSHT